MQALGLKYPSLIEHLIPINQGKTRDMFPTKYPDMLLIVATNRLSTHNVVHTSEVPRKGEVLTAMTIFWLTQVLDNAGIPHHLVACGSSIYDYLLGERNDYPSDLHHRAIVVKRLNMILVEFIFRQYLCGGFWDKFYSKGLQNPYGHNIPLGHPLMKKFSLPLFTPTDKSDEDIEINANDTKLRYPEAHDITLQAFILIRMFLRKLGIELIDSKFEVGLDSNGRAVLADEIVTPDSSRFAMKEWIEEGKNPAWLDKQIARDEAMRIWAGGPKIPLEFNPEIIQKLTETYLWIFEKVSGLTLETFQKKYLD